MTSLIRYTLIWAAILATGAGIVSGLNGMEPDTYVSTLIAILALGGVVLIDHLESERDRRLRDERERVWSRRDRQAGLS